MAKILLTTCLVSLALGAMAQSGNYRSIVASGNWADALSWERDVNGNGIFGEGIDENPSTVAPTTITGTVNVQSGHTISMNSVLVDVNSGGAVVVHGILNWNVSLPLKVMNVNSGGSLQSDGQINSTNSSRLKMNASSTYRHLFTNGGTIPAAAWAAGSTVRIVGFTGGASTTPAGLSQSFSNFIWDTPTFSGFIDLQGAPSTIGGDLIINNTGSGAVGYNFGSGAGTNTSFSVGGDLQVNSGQFGFVSGVGATATLNVNTSLTAGKGLKFSGVFLQIADDINTTVNVNGVVTFAAGDVELSASTAVTTVNVTGNYTALSGTVASSGPAASLNFTGTTSQIYNSTITPGNVNYTVPANAILTIPDDSYILGSGSFTLTGTLQVGDDDASGAIQNTTTAGNIRNSGSRTYNTGSTIIFNGVAGQFIGDGHPTVAGINTTINNSTGVSLIVGVPVIITTNLTLQTGDLNIGGGAFTLNGSLTPGANHITIGSGGSITIAGSSVVGTFPFPAATQTFTNFTLDNPNGVTFGSSAVITGVVTLTVGTLSFGSQTLSLNGTMAASGSGNLSLSSAGTLSIGGGGAFGQLKINSTNNTIGTFNFVRSSSGTGSVDAALFVATAFNLTNGDFTNTSGLQLLNGATLTRNSNARLLGNAPEDLPAGQSYNLSYTGSTIVAGLELPDTSDDMLGTLSINAPVTLDKNIIVHGNVNLQGSTFSAGGFNITMSPPVSSSWNKTSGSFAGGSGALTIGGAVTIVSLTTPNFTNITINGGASLTFPAVSTSISGNLANNGSLSASSGTMNFAGNTTISGSSTTTLNHISVSGTLVAHSGTMNVNGNFANNGTFTHNSGTVGFGGTTTISGSSTTSLNNVTITGTLTVPATTLNIAGNLTNTGGTFNNNNGTVLFNGGSSAQTISGSALTFNNINVSNPISVRVANTSRLNGVLTLVSSGVFDADGLAGTGVFIVSSTSQTVGGRIAAMTTPANFSGKVTMERYIHSQSGGDYRYLSMPLTNTFLSLWKNSVYVTGSFGDRSTSADNSNIGDPSIASVYTYNSATQGFVAVTGASTTTTGLNSRIAYSVYDFNDNAVTASYVTATGTIEKGAVPVSISTVNGNYSLVPNPYPSPIDWDNVTKTNVQDAMYVRLANGVYAAYVGGSATNAPFGGWTGEVATGQAFYVVSNAVGGGTLNFKENDKTSNSTMFLRTKSAENFIRVRLADENEMSDETLIHFVEEATDAFDPQMDAGKLKNGAFEPYPFNTRVPLNLSSFLGSVAQGEFAINTVGTTMDPRTINLNVGSLAAGKYTLHFTELASMTLDYKIALVDNFLHRQYDLVDNGAYEFTVNKAVESKGDFRFYLRINGSDIVTALPGEKVKALNVYPNPVKDKLFIDLTGEEEASLREINMIDISGRTVVTSDLDRSLLKAGQKTIDMSGFGSGVYILNIKLGETVRTTRVLKQ